MSAPARSEARAEAADGGLAVHAAQAADQVTDAVAEALGRLARPRRLGAPQGALVVALWGAGAALTGAVPDTDSFLVEGTAFLAILAAAVAGLFALAWAVSRVAGSAGARLGGRLGTWAPWLVANGAFLLVWEAVTAKLGVLRPPFFPAPQQLFAETWKDHALLARSFGSSLLLLAAGFFVGVAAGLATGIAMGWSRRAAYWINPFLKYIGPVPSLAWVPIVFVVFPTAYAGAVFLIALTVWFPVSLLTMTGIQSVPKSYYDVAQTLGASDAFLIWRISLPAALPNIFTGLFMALTTAFVTLTVAENFGVNAGLGWYINWKKGWSAYPAMYAAIILMVLFCSGLLWGLFAVRDRVLAWQRGLRRW